MIGSKSVKTHSLNNNELAFFNQASSHDFLLIAIALTKLISFIFILISFNLFFLILNSTLFPGLYFEVIFPKSNSDEIFSESIDNKISPFSTEPSKSGYSKAFFSINTKLFFTFT